MREICHVMKQPLLVFSLLLSGFPLSGCNTAALKAAPNDAARLGSEFHRQLDAEQWEAFYDAADSKYQEAVAPEKSQALLRAIHRKLGTLNKCTLESWQIQGTTNGTFLRATFASAYSTGATSKDSFVWHKDDGAYKMVNWNIDSEALILK